MVVRGFVCLVVDLGVGTVMVFGRCGRSFMDMRVFLDSAAFDPRG